MNAIEIHVECKYPFWSSHPWTFQIQTHVQNSPLKTGLQRGGTQELIYTRPSPDLVDVGHKDCNTMAAHSINTNPMVALSLFLAAPLTQQYSILPKYFNPSLQVAPSACRIATWWLALIPNDTNHVQNSPLKNGLQGEGAKELIHTRPSPYLEDVGHQDRDSPPYQFLIFGGLFVLLPGDHLPHQCPWLVSSSCLLFLFNVFFSNNTFYTQNNVLSNSVIPNLLVYVFQEVYINLSIL